MIMTVCKAKLEIYNNKFKTLEEVLGKAKFVLNNKYKD